MMMAVIFLRAYFNCCVSILRLLHMAMKELQDFPKMPSELMERLIIIIILIIIIAITLIIIIPILFFN